MIKLTSAANGNWIIFDNKRNTSNPLTDVLKADDSGVETTEAALNIDFLSNWKIYNSPHFHNRLYK